MDRPSPGLPQTGLAEYERLLALVDERRFDEALLRGQVLLEHPETAVLVRTKTHNLLSWLLIEGLKRPLPQAVLHAAEAVRLAEQRGDHELAVRASCSLAAALFCLGLYSEAEQTYHGIVDRLRQRPELLPFGQVIALQGLAQLALVSNRPEQALKWLTEAETLCSNSEGEALLAETYRRQAMALLRLGNPRQASAALAKVDESVLAAGPRGLWSRTHLGLTRSQVEVSLGRWSHARVLVVNTIALARELDDLPVLAEATCLLAAIEATEGRRDVRRRARTALTYAIQSGRRDVVAEVRDRMKAYLHTEV